MIKHKRTRIENRLQMYTLLKLSTLLHETSGAEHLKWLYCNQGTAVAAALTAWRERPEVLLGVRQRAPLDQ